MVSDMLHPAFKHPAGVVSGQCPIEVEVVAEPTAGLGGEIPVKVVRSMVINPAADIVDVEFVLTADNGLEVAGKFARVKE
jgi:hypothetical protein